MLECVFPERVGYSPQRAYLGRAAVALHGLAAKASAIASVTRDYNRDAKKRTGPRPPRRFTDYFSVRGSREFSRLKTPKKGDEFPETSAKLLRLKGAVAVIRTTAACCRPDSEG
ncbi:hypothetical protein EYF80_062893 [Liparis tanakae]|uniref:Uncharacterized protein n=1 Tax=Liparis tanakae TaxID=230148 RepID=A0A4Z2EDX5_9TELE|nr:hypothetical protein EYF80_062893 [Liparis tanakae]